MSAMFIANWCFDDGDPVRWPLKTTVANEAAQQIG
jgi:hypothetical protein